MAAPAIGAAKSVASSIPNPAGGHSVVYQILVRNYGDVALTNVNVVDDLSSAFAGAVYVRVLKVASETFAINENYDGTAQTVLLAAAEQLGIGEEGTITLEAIVTPGDHPGPLENSAVATGTGPDGVIVRDASQAGTDPDPDGNGDPTDNNDPTPMMVMESPKIGLAKNLVSSVNNGDGTFTVVYEFAVRNYGNVLLNELQINEDLAAAFPHPALCRLVSAESNDFTIVDSYDGAAVVGLLSGTDILDVGRAGTMRLTLCLSPKSGVLNYSNHAVASGRSPSGARALDRSQRGEDPDPDGDGDPRNNDEPTGLSFAEFEQGGILQTSVSWSDTVGFELGGISLSAFLSIEGFTAQLKTSFVNTGMDTFSVIANGTLSEVRVNSALTFDPSTVSFVSWQGGTAFSFLDLDVTNIVYLGVPQTTSYTQFAVSGTSGGLSAQGTFKLGICPLVFSAANVCGTWDWPRCDTSISACTLFTGIDGFISTTVSMTDYLLFENLLGVRWSLDVALSFTPEEKTLTPTLKLQPDWFICPDIELLGEISAGPGLASVEALFLYGIQGECAIGDHMTMRFAESLADEKNTAVTGKADYFELIGFSGTLPSCCESAGSFNVAAYFGRSSGALFDLGLITASFELQIIPNFALSFEAEFPTGGSNWKLAGDFKVLW